MFWGDSDSQSVFLGDSPPLVKPEIKKTKQQQKNTVQFILSYFGTFYFLNIFSFLFICMFIREFLNILCILLLDSKSDTPRMQASSK